VKKQAAIDLMQGQLDKLSRQNATQDWITQTAAYCKIVFGEGSEQFKHVSGWRAGVWVNAAASTEERRAIAQQEQHTKRRFLETCIETLQTVGPVKTPKTGFIASLSRGAIVTHLAIWGTIATVCIWGTSLVGSAKRDSLEADKLELQDSIAALRIVAPIIDTVVIRDTVRVVPSADPAKAKAKQSAQGTSDQ
jgi:hypothetical protein